MKAIIKKLLLEMISFSNTKKLKKDDSYIKAAYEKIGSEIIISRIQNLLSWLNPRHHFSDTNLEKYILYEYFMDAEFYKEEVYKEFYLLFKYLPELKQMFELKEKHIEFNSSLKKNDIQEIYNFVETNYIIDPRRITRYIRPEEK